MRVGLFFGTFNPVHRGHEALASSFLSSSRIDELHIVLTPDPPHKVVTELASLKARYDMLELVFREMPGVKLTVPEKDLPPPHYTVRTIDYIAGNLPDNRIVLCIGGDTLQTLPDWYHYRELAGKAEILVAERPGISRGIPPELESFTVYFCRHNAVDISSSQIRKEIAGNGSPPKNHLHPDVAGYIRKNGLYRK